MNALEQLQKLTVVVADTGDRSAIERFRPVDCTTNPSLVLSAFKSGPSAGWTEKVLGDCISDNMSNDQIIQELTCALAADLSELVPGRVSIEIDPFLSFDAEASVRSAIEIVSNMQKRGIPKSKILIKLASTWEGVKAASSLQKQGIDCNMTLIFSLTQAKASADAGAFLISPFVGRITDWYKSNLGVESFDPDSDPGVMSVREIYHHYKNSGVDTIVMGASFRSIEQVKALAGCDRLTISPNLLEQLSQDSSRVERVLTPTKPENQSRRDQHLSESLFRWGINEDPMTVEKLSEGIRKFNADKLSLLDWVKRLG